MFVRFVIHALDADSGRRQGLFQALGPLQQDSRLSPAQRALLDDTYAWFRVNLEVPDRLARSSAHHAHKAALGWFKDGATDHIRRMRVLAQLLAEHGYAVEMLKTARPGYIVYEDEVQIAAEPFADTPV